MYIPYIDELYIDINLILYDFIIENGGETLIYWSLGRL